MYFGELFSTIADETHTPKTQHRVNQETGVQKFLQVKRIKKKSRKKNTKSKNKTRIFLLDPKKPCQVFHKTVDC